jgi:hypothetical protein
MQALTLFVHRAIKVTTTSVINGDILLIEWSISHKRRGVDDRDIRNAHDTLGRDRVENTHNAYVLLILIITCVHKREYVNRDVASCKLVR